MNHATLFLAFCLICACFAARSELRNANRDWYRLFKIIPAEGDVSQKAHSVLFDPILDVVYVGGQRGEGADAVGFVLQIDAKTQNVLQSTTVGIDVQAFAFSSDDHSLIYLAGPDATLPNHCFLMAWSATDFSRSSPLNTTIEDCRQILKIAVVDEGERSSNYNGMYVASVNHLYRFNNSGSVTRQSAWKYSLPISGSSFRINDFIAIPIEANPRLIDMLVMEDDPAGRYRPYNHLVRLSFQDGHVVDDREIAPHPTLGCKSEIYGLTFLRQEYNDREGELMLFSSLVPDTSASNVVGGNSRCRDNNISTIYYDVMGHSSVSMTEYARTSMTVLQSHSVAMDTNGATYTLFIEPPKNETSKDLNVFLGLTSMSRKQTYYLSYGFDNLTARRTEIGAVSAPFVGLGLSAVGSVPRSESSTIFDTWVFVWDDPVRLEGCPGGWGIRCLNLEECGFLPAGYVTVDKTQVYSCYDFAHFHACDAGGYCRDGQRHNCSRGTWSTTIAATSSTYCRPCYGGSYNPNEGQTACLLCPMDTYDDGGYLPLHGVTFNDTCMPCVNGTHEEGSTTCDNPQPPRPPHPTDDGSSDSGKIIAISLGCVAGVAILAAGICFYQRRRRDSDMAALLAPVPVSNTV
eukprot:TRINITY_DN2208_c0_g1_i1.p1 TRINITY_DN2208_c0_g1~~TRINITY_DN2208_c0_g1_i1.p1  ORF type:complete len:651 (-),score=108.32 TRINITY_DN2208_c0_g1_i1:420-2312(-)